MLTCLLSAKGAPGVTTAGLCLAAAGTPNTVLIEADPSGGDLECWTGPHGVAGLPGLATTLRPGMSTAELQAHAVAAVAGVSVVTAPTTAAAMAPVLVQVAGAIGSALTGSDADVVVDLGRWDRSHRLVELIGAAAVVLVVCHPTLASVEHARGLVAPGSDLDGATSSVGLLVVGGADPYGPDEIAAAVDRPVLGVLPWDRRGVAALLTGGTGRAWHRTRLAAAAAELHRRLHHADHRAGAHG